MSAYLFPTLPLSLDELPTSFVSRLAQLHRAPTAATFCKEIGLGLQAVSHGDPSALARLADMSGAPLERLELNTFRTLQGVVGFRSERLRKSCLYPRAQRVCPDCLADDRRRRPDLGELAAYGRSMWRLGALRTCPAHRRKLSHIPYKSFERDYRLIRHDFCTLLSKISSQPIDDSADLEHAEPSSFEMYLHDRISDDRADPCWLDGLPYYAVERACEIFGCVERYGPTRILNSLNDDEWSLAGASGFDILRLGPAGVLEFLRALRAKYGRGGTTGSLTIYGSLYRWLSFESGNSDYSPLRDVMVSHFVEDVGHNVTRNVFGITPEQRTKLTVRSASKIYGLKPRNLRSILKLSGLIPVEHAALSNDKITFDAAAADPILRGVRDGLSLSAVAAYLAATRLDVFKLVEHEYLQPLFRGGQGQSPLRTYVFSKNDVDAFLARLYASVGKPPPAAAQIYNLPEASRRARRFKIELIGLILSGKLDWIGADAGSRTLDAIQVDLTEINRHLQGSFGNLVVAGKAAKVLGIGVSDIYALADRNLLCVSRSRHPKTQMPYCGIEKTSLDEFRRSYISSLRVAQRYRRRVDHIEATAAAHNVDIVYRCHGRRFAIYRLTEITKILSAKPRRRSRRRLTNQGDKDPP